MNLISKFEPSSDSLSDMTILRVCSLALVALLFGSCQSNVSNAPPVTASFLRASAHPQRDIRFLSQGRTLFLNRCIQCHALPEVARFDAARLTAILATMSG